MSVLLVVLVIAVALIVLGNILRSVHPKESHRHDFHSRMQRGQMDVTTEFHYRDRDCEIHGKAQKITNEWAIELDDPQEGRQLYRQLESELLKNGLGDYNPRVIVIALKLDPVPPTPEVKLSPAEKIITDLKAKTACATQIAEIAGVDVSNVKGASLHSHIKDFAETRIRNLFRHPDEV
jgi:hypothetical protein